MLKFGITADNHFGDKREVLGEVVRCTNLFADTAKREKLDAVIISGDLMDTRVMMDSPAALAAKNFIMELAKICPVLLVRGTDLHDFDSLEMFRGLANVMVISDVRQVFFKKGFGFCSVEGEIPGAKPDAVISCLPSLSKAFLLSVGVKPDAAENETVRLVEEVVRGWGIANRKWRKQGVVTIVAGHGTVAGAVSSTGHVMVGHDLTYGKETLEAADADLVVFGHIHKAQKTGPAWFCGSIARLNNGENEAKGFYLADLEAGKKATPSFIVTTPERVVVDIDLGEDPADWEAKLQERVKDIPKGALIKVKVKLAETRAADITPKRVEAIIGQPATLAKDVVSIQRTRAAGISMEKTDVDKFRRWAESSGITVDEDLLKRVHMLNMDEKELVAAVLAGFGKNNQEVPESSSDAETSRVKPEIKDTLDLFAGVK